jgi:hypothetical protein
MLPQVIDVVVHGGGRDRVRMAGCSSASMRLMFCSGVACLVGVSDVFDLNHVVLDSDRSG